MSKRIKLFEGFLDEKLVTTKTGGDNCSSDVCRIFLPQLEIINNLVSKQTTPNELIKIQSEVNKFQKMVTDEIRHQSINTTEEVNWDKSPKAPVFILNLVNKYPQNEKKYYDLWYKAALRLPVFSYGGAIAIFKTYAKREELTLESMGEWESIEPIDENFDIEDRS